MPDRCGLSEVVTVVSHQRSEFYWSLQCKAQNEIFKSRTTRHILHRCITSPFKKKFRSTGEVYVNQYISSHTAPFCAVCIYLVLTCNTSSSHTVVGIVAAWAAEGHSHSTSNNYFWVFCFSARDNTLLCLKRSIMPWRVDLNGFGRMIDSFLQVGQI